MRQPAGWAVVVAGLVAACASGGGQPDTPNAAPRQPSQPPAPDQAVSFSVIPSRSSFEGEEPIRFVLRLENAGTETATFRFNSGCRAFFEIEHDGRPIFHFKSHTFCTQALTSLTLKPSERIELPFSWDRLDGAGERVPSGTYTVVAFLANGAGPRVNASIQLR